MEQEPLDEPLLVLRDFGYRPERLDPDEFERAVDEVVAFARAGLERIALHGPRPYVVARPERVVAAFGRSAAFLPLS